MSHLGNVFLFGGGWDPSSQGPERPGRFLEAAARSGRRKVALVVVAQDGASEHEALSLYGSIFDALHVPAEELTGIPVSPQRPLLRERLAEVRPTAVLVGGGLTPAYHSALCRDRGWLEELREQGLPYGGFSAGAAIAAERALLGGWKVVRAGVERAVAPARGGRGPGAPRRAGGGLGLVPFSVEVHASQWGTLTRLMQAVDLGLCPDGWAIDEDTLLQVQGSRIEIHGRGHAYRVCRSAGGRLEVESTMRRESSPEAKAQS